MTATNKMKAMAYNEFGGIEKLKLTTFAIPVPAENEVQVQIEYAAVNPIDWKIRSGIYQKKIPYEFPIIPGFDASGKITAIGENVTQFKMGDEVFAYFRKPVVGFGTYAEYICFDEDLVSLKPFNMTFAEASAIPLAGLTAWQSLFDAAQLKLGETILIQAGAGGVGSLAIQFAKNVGATILTTATEEKHEYVKDLGADVAIDYKKQNVKEEIKKRYPQGIDVVFDTLGGQANKESYSYLKPGGRLVSLLEQPNLELADKFQVHPFYVFVKPNGKQLREIAHLIEANKVKPIPLEELPLEKAGEAQQRNQEGRTVGKIILKIKNS